ncbi:MAG TPA: carboxypeptidase-like regulatory domain-containing protein, partial [Pyrinomonadaceae bacterium]|nr:carboxypeptidase-like regulatory domain-containing protein [Pyrinomonadaceae bacterium]
MNDPTDTTGNSPPVGASASQNAFQIGGQVTDDKGTGLQQVTVVLSGTQQAEQTTDADGRFLFTGLAKDGSYIITPQRLSYTFKKPSVSFDKLSRDEMGVKFVGKLTYYSIKGQVKDQDGLPLPNVELAFTGEKLGSVLTNQAGDYTVENLGAGGTYKLTPSKAAYTFEPPDIDVGPLTAKVSSKDFAAKACLYEISGTTTDSSGVPLSGVTITLAGKGTQTAQSDASGNYKFPDVSGGRNYMITPGKPGYIFTPPTLPVLYLADNLRHSFYG